MICTINYKGNTYTNDQFSKYIRSHPSEFKKGETFDNYKKSIDDKYNSDPRIQDIGSLDDFYNYISRSSPYSNLSMDNEELIPGFDSYMDSLVNQPTPFVNEEEVYQSIKVVPNTQIVESVQLEKKLKAKLNSLYDRKSKGENIFKLNNLIEKYKAALTAYKRGDRDEKDKQLILLAQIDISEVEHILNTTPAESITDTQLNAMNNAVILWGNLDQYIISDLPEVQEILSKTRRFENKLSELINEHLKRVASGANLEITDSDINYLKETSQLASNVLDISNSQNKLIRMIATQLSKANFKKAKAMESKMDSLKKAFKGVSKKDAQFIFKRGTRNTLKQEVKEEFIEARRAFSERYRMVDKNKDKIIDLINSYMINNPNYKIKKNTLVAAGILSSTSVMALEKSIDDNQSYIAGNIDAATEIAFYAIKNDIGREERIWTNENVVSLDPRAFDVSIDADERKRLISDFIDKTGNRHYAELKVRYGEHAWNRYMRLREAFKVYASGVWSEDINEMEYQIKMWEIANSPIVRYDILYGDLSRAEKKEYFTSRELYGEFYPEMVDAPRADKGHYDPEFQTILNTPKYLKIYNIVKEIMNEAKDIYPMDVRNGTNAGFVFLSRTKQFEMLRNSGLSAELIRNVAGSLVAEDYKYDMTQAVDEFGNPLLRIPTVQFRNIDAEIDKLKFELSEATTPAEREEINNRIKILDASYTIDIESSMAELIKDMYNYKYMSEIEPLVRLEKYKVNKAKQIKPDNTYIEGGAKNEKARLNYSIDAILFGKYKETEGQANSDEFFADQVFANSKLAAKAKEIAKEAIELRPQYEIIEAKVIMEEDLTPEEETIYRRYNFLKAQYKSLDGKRLTASKASDTMIHATQQKVLGLSPISGINNLLFGIISNIIDSHGGEFFNKREYARAMAIMKDSVAHYATVGKAGNTANRNKIVNYLRKNNILFEMLEANFGKEQVPLDVLFTFLKSSDFYMKSTTVVATLLNRKIMSKNGEISIWDALNSEGELDESKFTQEQIDEWNENGRMFEAIRIQKINKKIHGNVDPSAMLMIKNIAIGRFLTQFRISWLAEGFYNRWGAERDDEHLGKVKGRYRSIGTAVKAFRENTGVSGIMDRIQDTWTSLDSTDKANMRKNLMELAFYVTLLSMGIVLKYLAGNADDDEKRKLMLLINLCFRLRQDIGYYANADTASDLFKNVVPAVTLITDTEKFFTEAIEYIQDPTDKQFDSATRAFLKSIPVGRAIITLDTYTNKYLSDIANR